jgi:HEAT repeat protein
MGQEDIDLLTDIMINAVVRERQKDSSTVKLAVVTLGKLKQSKAVPYLTDLLKTQAIRKDVIQALGDIGDKASLTVLLGELASEGDASVKALIVRALGVIGEKDAISALETLLKAPDTAAQPDTQRAVLGALVRISSVSSPDAVLQEIFRSNLASEDPQARILAIRGLACAKNNAQAATRILEALKKETLDEVKVEAIAGLRKLQLSTLIQSLLGILQDPNSSESVKKAAIGAIGGSNNAEQAVGLVSDQLASPSAVLRDAAAEALLKLYGSAPKPVVASLSRVTAVKASDETALTAATGVLARIADVSSIPSLTPLLASRFVEVKKNVTWALYRMKPSQNVAVVEELKRIAKSETEALLVRINAVRALGAMRTDSAQLKVWETLTTILKMRGEKYASLRLFAVKALGDLGNPIGDAVDALSRTAERDTDPQMVLEAVSALQKLSLQDPDVETALLNVFKKTRDTETKVRVIEALGDIDSSSTVDPAAEILRLDIGPSLKKRIIYALSQVGGQRELNVILDAVRDATLRDYSQGVLEESNPAVLAAVVRKRMTTETNKDVMDALDGLNPRLEGQ